MKAFLQECCVDAVYNNERSWWMTISRVTAGIDVQVSRSMWVSSHNYDDLFERARNHWQEMQSVPLPLSLLYHNEQPQHPILLLHTHLISYIPVILGISTFLLTCRSFARSIPQISYVSTTSMPTHGLRQWVSHT